MISEHAFGVSVEFNSVAARAFLRPHPLLVPIPNSSLRHLNETITTTKTTLLSSSSLISTGRHDVRHGRWRWRGGEAREEQRPVAAAGRQRQSRVVARHGRHVQVEVHVETLHGGANVGLLHRVQRASVVGHAEPELAEGVPGKPAPGQRYVRRAGEPVDRQLHEGRRGGRARAGGRHDHMEDDRAEQHTVRADHIHRVLERPEPQAQAVYAHTDRRRIPHQHWAARVHVLLLPAAHGGGRPG